MAMTPDELASRVLLARILWWRKNLEKLDAYAVNTLLKTLASANANIRAQIKKDLPKVWDKLNYKEFRLWLGETTKPALDAVTDTITESWAVSAAQSLNAYNSILSFDGQAKNIQQVPITVDTVKALAAASPFTGQKLSTFVQAIFHDGVAATMLQCVDDAMKKGWGYKKVVKSLLNEAIDKGFQITQTQAITLSRSYIQQASVNAQMAVYEKNKDVVKGVKWTAILDNRVCGKCAALDGQTYAWDEQRPPLIAHPRCRCLWLPWLKSYRDLGLDIDDLEEAERNWVIREGGNIDAGGNRKILEAGTTKEIFPGWWKTLPYDEQVKSIGPTRTKLINDGRITWADLIDRNTGRYYTLAEIAHNTGVVAVKGGSGGSKTPQSQQQTQVFMPFIKPVANNQELVDQLKQELSKHTRNGPATNVVFDNNPNRFMATNSHGYFVISQVTDPSCNNFNPRDDLFNAWNKIATGKPLTFNEEYAIESIWHETTHNRQTPTYAGGQNTESRRQMETITQWVARRKYPDFLKSLGGQAQHQAKILIDGYGYNHIIHNFDKLRTTLGIADDAKILSYFEGVIQSTDRKKYKKAIVDYFVKESQINTKRKTIDDILKYTKEHEIIFENIMRNILGIP